MRFDDSLRTVLAADATTAFGAASAWRQLVDLIGRGRAPASTEALARLRAIRGDVPVDVRAASARALAFAAPGAALVSLFAEEELAIAAPVLRTAMLDGEDWAELLPRLTPTARSVLRHRRDLPDAARRALESFGAVDFVLPYEAPPPPAELPAPPADTPRSESPFVALGAIAKGLPVVAEALRQVDVQTPLPAVEAPAQRFEIADLVARIDAYTKRREDVPARPAAPQSDHFDFQTDAVGVVRWVKGVARSSVIGITLASSGDQAGSQLDGVASGGFRRRSPFSDARLTIGGLSEAAGSWRISGVPIFDPATGRFSGYHGSARRPRADETAVPSPKRSAASESLRQLVHELRTPTNAIAGFAELIESELLGSVPLVYRDRASTIRAHAADLIQAIDDLDVAARIEGNTLELRTGVVPVAALLERVVADLEPLAGMRGAIVETVSSDGDLAIAGDDRAVERLVGRLTAALVSAGGSGERIRIAAAREGDRIALVIARPVSLATIAEDALLSIDAERETEVIGAPLLGTGFALRLARNLAAELGGGLAIGADRLTLRLPAASTPDMGQASIH